MLQQILVKESHLYQIVFTTFTIHTKLRFFYETTNNLFLNGDEFAQTYYRVIKVYHGFRKFVQIYKFQKAKIVVTTDLNLSEIDTDNKDLIYIHQQNNRYMFIMSDLLHIIVHSLSSSHAFFSTPQNIKNPYTNLPFNKSTLYNIYFFNQGPKPELFELFFKYNFNIKLFAKSCEHILREYAIKDYVFVRYDVDEMILAMNIWNGQYIWIDPDFPTKQLIQIMRPYLLLWLSYLYSLVPTKQVMAQQTLFKKWRAFVKHNPQFGRRIIRWGTNKITEFNCDAPRFVSDRSFMNNHVYT